MSEVPFGSLYIILHDRLAKEGGRQGDLPIERARLILSRSMLGMTSVRAKIVLTEMEAYGLIRVSDNIVRVARIDSMGLPFL